MSTPALIAASLLCLLGLAMVVWAWLTGDLAPRDVTATARSMPKHSSQANGEGTERLRPAAPEEVQPLWPVEEDWSHGRKHGWRAP